MPQAKLIIKNMGALFVSDAIGSVLSFLLIVFIARYLGDVGLGKYSFAFAFVGLFMALSDLGTEKFVVREIAKDRSKMEKYSKNFIALKLILGIIALILPGIIILFLNEPADVIRIVWLASTAMFFNYFGWTFTAFFQAYEKMEYDAIGKLIERVIAFSLGSFVLANGYGLMALLLVLILSNLIVFIVKYMITSKKIIRIGFEIDLNFLKKLLKRSFPFLLTIVFIMIYFRISTVMLTFMRGYAVTGWFEAAYRIVDGLKFFPIIVITAVFPAMSKLHVQNKKFLLLLYKKSFYYLFSLAFPLGIGTTLLASRIILFVYKQEFIHSVLALQILIWAEVFIFINYLMGYLLNAINRAKLFTISTGICVVVNVLLNFMLITAFKDGYPGASIAIVITEVINFILLLYFTSKSGYKLPLIRLIYKPIIAGLLMGAGIIYLNQLHLLLLIPLAAIAYFIILFLTKGIEKEEIELVKGFFRLSS